MKNDELLHYESCGLDYVWLRNGFTPHSTPYGDGVSIHDVDGLHKAIGLFLVFNQPSLSGQEVRFLRKELDMPQVDLAKTLGVSESTIRGWENDRNEIAPPADKLLRILYVAYVCKHPKIRELVDRVSQINREKHEIALELEETGAGWSAAA